MSWVYLKSFRKELKIMLWCLNLIIQKVKVLNLNSLLGKIYLSCYVYHQMIAINLDPASLQLYCCALPSTPLLWTLRSMKNSNNNNFILEKIKMYTVRKLLQKSDSGLVVPNLNLQGIFLNRLKGAQRS